MIIENLWLWFDLLLTAIFLVLGIQACVTFFKDRTKYNLAMLIVMSIFFVTSFLDLLLPGNTILATFLDNLGVGMGVRVPIIIVFSVLPGAFLLYPDLKWFLFQRNMRKNPSLIGREFQKRLKKNPQNPEILFQYAYFLWIIKDYDGSEEYFKKAFQLDPKNINTIENYASFLIHVRKDYDQAENIYRKAMENNPSSAACLGFYANFLYYFRKQKDKANGYFLEAIDAEPKNADIFREYANFCWDIQDYDRAEEYYKKAIELGPRNGKNFCYYASFLMEIRKEYDRAEELFRKAIKLAPNSSEVIGYYADFLINVRKDYDYAEKLERKVIKLYPENKQVLRNYSLFLTDIRKAYGQAEYFYKKVIESGPYEANDFGNYAKNLISERNLDEAKEMIKKAFEYNRENKDLRLELELWFYCYAVFHDEFSESGSSVETLLKQGVRSPGWNLKDVLEIAKEKGHPDYQKLSQFESMIAGTNNV